MLITEFSADLKPFQDVVEDFAAQRLGPNIKDTDQYPFTAAAAEVTDDLFNELFKLGFLEITVPEDLGGTGQGITALCMALSSIAEIDASFAGFIFTTALSQEILIRASAGKHLADIHANARSARDYVVAFPAFSNPAHTSQLPRAVAHGAHEFDVSGLLEYVVLGNYSRWAIVPGVIDGDSSYSLFLVDLDAPDIAAGEPIFSLGLHALRAVDLTFHSTRALLLGVPSDGAKYFEEAAGALQVATAAIAAGIIRGSLLEAFEYAQERRQGGRTIINWSEVRMMLANMVMRSKTADLCVAQGCHDQEIDLSVRQSRGAAAALLVHEMANDVVNDGVQLLGGNGYTKDYGQEKRYRDVRQVQALLGAHSLKKLDLLKTFACERI
jgi:alkylation response protein AidB-like acyl-CoA dehydrogenase